jgi:hypothetical protein
MRSTTIVGVTIAIILATGIVTPIIVLQSASASVNPVSDTFRHNLSNHALDMR